MLVTFHVPAVMQINPMQADPSVLATTSGLSIRDTVVLPTIIISSACGVIIVVCPLRPAKPS